MADKKKFQLKNEQKMPLQVFFFTAQTGKVHTDVLEDVHAYLAYDEPSAINLISQLYPFGTPVSIRKRAAMPVEHIVDQLELPTGTSKEEPPSPAPQQLTKEMKEQEFINGLKLAADRFVTDKRDRASLHRIIGKVQKKYESKQDS